MADQDVMTTPIFAKLLSERGCRLGEDLMAATKPESEPAEDQARERG